MAEPQEFILGEVLRSLDERYRLSIPSEMVELLVSKGNDCILAKERSGCLSLWNTATWQSKLDDAVELIRGKMRSGRLEGRIDDVQRLGRLLSTRHRRVQITGRGRLLIPEGFREFLGVESGGNVLVVGAALCVEIWNPQHWLSVLEQQMPEFRQLLDRLAD